eukprot:13740755-Alexandrium_andersonii.AAC.1
MLRDPPMPCRGEGSTEGGQPETSILPRDMAPAGQRGLHRCIQPAGKSAGGDTKAQLLTEGTLD